MIPYLSFTTKVALGTVVDYLNMGGRKNNNPIRIKRIVMADETNNVSATQEIGIVSGGRHIPIYEVNAAGVAGISIALSCDFVLGSDQDIYAAFNVATVGDQLWLLVLGEYI